LVIENRFFPFDSNQTVELHQIFLSPFELILSHRNKVRSGADIWQEEQAK